LAVIAGYLRFDHENAANGRRTAAAGATQPSITIAILEDVAVIDGRD
jgi:hypothetical protein